MGSASCYQPNPAAVNSNLTVNGVVWAQAAKTAAGLDSQTLLEADTTPDPILSVDSGGNLIVSSPAAGAGQIKFGLNGGFPFAVSKFGIIAEYDNRATVGNGIAAEAAIVATGSPVALATSSTTVLTLASSLTTGKYLISVNAVSTAAAQVATFTVAYEDNSFSVACTATITSGTLGSGASFGDTIEINAATGTAITVAGSCTTANDVKATATIFGPL